VIHQQDQRFLGGEPLGNTAGDLPQQVRLPGLAVGEGVEVRLGIERARRRGARVAPCMERSVHNPP
ncbi:hypothetical protein, partial [Amycolatopsis stemonae]